MRKYIRNKIKNFVRKHRYFQLIVYLFRFKRVFSDLLYKYKENRNIPFKYHLPDGSFIRLYPCGQIAKPIYVSGFEEEEIRLFFALLKPDIHIVDAVANIGLYSIIARKKIGENGKIWVFEPSAQNYKRFLQNLSLNQCDDSVDPVNLGLGNIDSEKLFLRRDEGYGDAEKYLLPENNIPSEELPNVKRKVEEEIVTLTTLDSFMEKIKNSRVDIIKIDTEGYEYYVLQGARKILESNPNMILFLECTKLGTSRAGHTQQDVYNFLNEFGFCCFYWDSEKKAWGTDKTILFNTGNIWACRSVEQLPFLGNNSAN